MKIEYAWNDGVTFGSLTPGDCFLFEGKIFMRVDSFCKIDYEGDELEYNAIDLVRGSWIGIPDTENVVPVDGKFVVDP